MAHWKYHLESGDGVKFPYEDDDGHHRYAWGTVRGFTAPPDFDDDEVESYDDIDLSNWTVHITSGRHDFEAPIADLDGYESKDDRETDLPLMSERLRFRGGPENYTEDDDD